MDLAIKKQQMFFKEEMFIIWPPQSLVNNLVKLLHTLLHSLWPIISLNIDLLFCSQHFLEETKCIQYVFQKKWL